MMSENKKTVEEHLMDFKNLFSDDVELIEYNKKVTNENIQLKQKIQQVTFENNELHRIITRNNTLYEIVSERLRESRKKRAQLNNLIRALKDENKSFLKISDVFESGFKWLLFIYIVTLFILIPMAVK